MDPYFLTAVTSIEAIEKSQSKMTQKVMSHYSSELIKTRFSMFEPALIRELLMSPQHLSLHDR